MQTTVIPNWSALDLSALRLPMFVVYRRPADHPDKIVVRLWDTIVPTPYVVLFDDVEDAIADLQERGLVRIERAPGDEPHIVCVYL